MATERTRRIVCVVVLALLIFLAVWVVFAILGTGEGGGSLGS
jgi:hypothetical protein